ncbi:hypothetical protein N8862_00265 [Pseudomonadales bacterium]|nr:hypothetical protein [Pseudomonadales bacterium]
MISVNMVAANVYEVVLEGSEESIHRVTLSPELYKEICGGTFTQEWVLIQAFRFMLEFGQRSEIAKEFDLSELTQRYEYFVIQMQDRLGKH